MTNPNQELLIWAVENITTWNYDYTHLRSDDSRHSLFFSIGPFIKDEDGTWCYDSRNGDVWDVSVIYDKSFCTKPAQVITKQEWLDGVAAKNAPKTSPEAQQGHVHAELMAEYALVAKTNPEPWKEFQRLNLVNEWEDLLMPTAFHTDREYRRKPTPPKTMNIGGVIVEAWPLDTAPKYKEEFYYVHLQDKFVVEELLWSGYGCGFCSQLELGRSFSTKEQAQAVADALNLVYNRAIGKA